jgi:hypothetical protein
MQENHSRRRTYSNAVTRIQRASYNDTQAEAQKNEGKVLSLFDVIGAQADATLYLRGTLTARNVAGTGRGISGN